MSLLTAVQSVCAVVGVMRPTAVIPNMQSNRTMFEMYELATTMAQRIAFDTREWGALKSLATFTGGIGMTIEQKLKNSCSFPLPVDYQRMLLTGNVWRSTSTLTAMRFIADTEEWTQRRFANQYASQGEWAIHSAGMNIAPVLLAERPSVDPLTVSAWVNGHDYVKDDLARDTVDNTVWKVTHDHTSLPTGTFAEDRAAAPNWVAMIIPAETVHFNYLSNAIVNQSVSGTRGKTFVNDDDTFALDERLLILGMIWQWKANKGSPYAEDMANYQDALTRGSGSDKPAPILVGRQPISANVTVAIPWGPGWGPQ